MAPEQRSSWHRASALVDKIPNLDVRREARRSIEPNDQLARQVTVFHNLYNLPIIRPSDAHNDFSHITKNRLAMRFGLIVEEFMELCEAMDIRADINFYYEDENGEYVKALAITEMEALESGKSTGYADLVEFPEGGARYITVLNHDKISNELLHTIVRERLQRSIEETDERDLAGVADACGDLKYVIQGFELEVGIPAGPVLAEIQCSNLSKLGEDGNPIYREDGKVLKGPNYFQADIVGVLKAHGVKVTGRI